MKKIILLLVSSVHLFSYSMSEYINKHDDLNAFNYQKYLETTSFSNLKKLENDRIIANKKKLGNAFLYNLTDTFINANPLDIDKIEDRIALGEKLLNYSIKKQKKDDTIYSYMGYYLLSDCSHTLEKEILDNSSDWLFFIKNFSTIKQLKIRLVKSKIFIRSKKHDAKKVIDHIRHTEFEYVWNRIYLKFFYEEKTTEKSKLTLQPFSVNNTIDNKIFYILNNNNKIGEIIWIDSSKYKVHYFSHGNIKDKYEKFLSENNIKARAALTGGFVNDHSYPEGLTIENGEIINASLMPNRDALIIIEHNGKSHIINLKEGSFVLPNNEKINPLKSVADYAKLLNWSKVNHGSIFQTQLLAFDNKLLFNTQKKKHKSPAKERRLLVVASNLKENKEFHIIINIREGVNLALITKKIFEIVKIKKYNVEAILNLDVGSYNIMEIYDKNETRILNELQPLTSAKNLLFYTE